MHLYACLPFVELIRSEGIKMGPVHFWPSSEYSQHIENKLHKDFVHYLETVGEIKAFSDSHSITTLQLAPNLITCVSLDENIEDKQELLIDALYMLYFAITYRNVYYDQDIPSIASFTRVIPAEEQFIANHDNWVNAHIAEDKREPTACIHSVDDELVGYLGQILQKAYVNKDEESTRVLRAIRYFMDRFFHKFKNPIQNGLQFASNLFDPEDIIFLGSSFDSLLNISENHSSSDFKQKIRPILQLKFSRPLETFWDWVDGFYQLKRQTVHGNLKVEMFNKNPNYNVDFVKVGLKLFIYIAYYKLCSMSGNLKENGFNPPEFKNLHPDELLKYFWSEDAILRKLSLLMMQPASELDKTENENDIQQLTQLYVRFFEKDCPGFLPQNRGAFETYAKAIIDHEKKYHHLFADKFLVRLKERTQL